MPATDRCDGVKINQSFLSYPQAVHEAAAAAAVLEAAVAAAVGEARGKVWASCCWQHC